jgi:hypothetical protein
MFRLMPFCEVPSVIMGEGQIQVGVNLQSRCDLVLLALLFGAECSRNVGELSARSERSLGEATNPNRGRGLTDSRNRNETTPL